MALLGANYFGNLGRESEADKGKKDFNDPKPASDSPGSWLDFFTLDKDSFNDYEQLNDKIGSTVTAPDDTGRQAGLNPLPPGFLPTPATTQDMFLSDAPLSESGQLQQQPPKNHDVVGESVSPKELPSQTSCKPSEAPIGEKSDQQSNEIQKPVSFLRRIYELRKAFDAYQSLPMTEESVVTCDIGLDDFEILLWFEGEQSTRLDWSEPSVHKVSYSRFLQRRVQIQQRPDSFLRQVCVLRDAFRRNSSPQISEIEQISCETGLDDFEVSFWFETEKKIQLECLTTSMSYRQDPWSPHCTHSSMYSHSSLTGTSLVSDNVKLNPSIHPEPGIAGNLHLDLVQWERPSLTARSNKRRRAVHNSSNATSASLSSPPDKRMRSTKVQGSYPCLFENCTFKAADLDKWRDHQTRSHFPKHVWICWLKKDDESECKHGPVTRSDNFVTHVVNEHHRSRGAELQKLVKSKFLNVRNLYHEECGFCPRKLSSWAESMKHISEHLTTGSTAESWEHRCSTDHDLLSHIEYNSGDHHHSDHNGKPEDEDEQDDDTDPKNGDAKFGDQDQEQQDPENQNDDRPESGDRSEWEAGPSSTQKEAEDNDMPVDFQYSSSDSTTMSLQANEVDTDYVSLEMLGHGGFSFVDKIFHRLSKKTYARKTTFYRKSPSREAVELQFNNEVDILKTLQHPHLIKFIDAYTLQDRLSIIMSPVADESLTSFMSRFDKFPLDLQKSNKSSLWRWMSCLASALRYLHDHLIRHQDIKPSNILVRGDQVFLTDFGNARKFLDNDQAQARDFRNKLTVTPMYCPPEAMRSGLQGFTADVFSLGCVYAEIITLCLDQTLADFELFRSPNPYDGAFRNQLEKTVEWIESLQEDYRQAASQHTAPPSISLEMICHMLDQDPEQRPTARQIQLQMLPCTCCSTVVTAMETNEELVPLHPSHIENALDQDGNGDTLPKTIANESEVMLISEVDVFPLLKSKEHLGPQTSHEVQDKTRIAPRPAQVSDYESETNTEQIRGAWKRLETRRSTSPSSKNSSAKPRAVAKFLPELSKKSSRSTKINVRNHQGRKNNKDDDNLSTSDDSSSSVTYSDSMGSDHWESTPSFPLSQSMARTDQEERSKNRDARAHQNTRFDSPAHDPPTCRSPRSPNRRRPSYDNNEPNAATTEDSVADAYYSGVVAGVAAAARRAERIPPTPPLTNSSGSIRTGSNISEESRSMESRSTRESLGSCVSADDNPFRFRLRDEIKHSSTTSSRDYPDDYLRRNRRGEEPKLRDAEYDHGFNLAQSRRERGPRRAPLPPLSRIQMDSYGYMRNPFVTQGPIYRY